jgi:hypothetical protein
MCIIYISSGRTCRFSISISHPTGTLPKWIPTSPTNACPDIWRSIERDELYPAESEDEQVALLPSLSITQILERNGRVVKATVMGDILQFLPFVSLRRRRDAIKEEI